MEDIDELIESAAKSQDFDEHFPFIRSLLGQAIQLNPASGGKSAIGGAPRLPANFDWPEHARGHQTCIAQLDCSELPTTTRLPSTGLLTFFAAHDPDGDSWFWEEEFMQIHYFMDLSVEESPTATLPMFPRRPVSFDLKYSLPFNPYLRDDWPWDDDDHDAFEYGVSEELGDIVVRTSGDFLLGHAPGSRIAGNPCPGDDWELLLLLRTDDDLEMIWGDDSALMVFVESEALAQLDFSNPKCLIA
ncbi:MAG: DUF1963 domain-containing protein [Planctomycetota bacterium]